MIIKGINEEIEILDEYNKFSLIRIEGLRDTDNFEWKKNVLFHNIDYHYYARKRIFNSGERFLGISVNSLEEYEDISRLFREGGFRVIQDKNFVLFPNIPKKRFWIDPQNLNIPVPESPRFDGDLAVGGYIVKIRLYKKDVQQLYDFLEYISKEYLYRTFYLKEDPIYNLYNQFLHRVIK